MGSGDSKVEPYSFSTSGSAITAIESKNSQSFRKEVEETAKRIENIQNSKAAPKAKVSLAKARFLKAKTAISASRAFADSAKTHATRCHVAPSPSHPWIAKRPVRGMPSSGMRFRVDDIQMGRILGTGLMGTVRVARLKKEGMYCAIKTIRKDYICKFNDGRHVRNERRILLEINHPFVLSLFGTFQDRDSISLVMELLSGGELFKRLERKQWMRPDVAKFYAVEIALALEHLAQHQICYRDLKPENILLDEQGHCKLVDFGFAIHYHSDDDLLQTNVGTPAYLSPEQLNKKFHNGYPARVVDWWAYGCVVFEMLLGRPPFCRNHKETAYAIYTRVVQGNLSFPRRFPGHVKSLIKKLLNHDLTKRLVESHLVKEEEWLQCDWVAVSQRRAVPPFAPRLKEDGDVHYFDYYDDKHTQEFGAVDDSEFSEF